MADSPSDPLVNKDRMREIADEQDTGAHFDGESNRERCVGIDREVVVDIFKRNFDSGEQKAGTYFLRVSLRSMINPQIISRYHIDLDRYSNEGEFLDMCYFGGGAVAEADNENRGATWDTQYVAKQARDAARELLRDIDNQPS